MSDVKKKCSSETVRTFLKISVPAAEHDQNNTFTVRMMNGHVWPLIKWKPAVMHYFVGRLQIWNAYEYKHIKTEWMDTGE